MSFKKTFLIGGLFVSLLGCASALYFPTQKDADASATPLDSLQAGRKLYVSSCGSCHTLYLPQAYTATEWQHFTNSMQKRAKINNNQKALILKYVSAAAKK